MPATCNVVSLMKEKIVKRSLVSALKISAKAPPPSIENSSAEILYLAINERPRAGTFTDVYKGFYRVTRPWQ